MNLKKLPFAALLLFCGLFSACSDDEDEKWQKLPTTPIEIDGSNATMTVNGVTSTTGQVTFKAESESRATLTLTDAVGGYPNLEIPVEMTLAADGSSYTFTGKHYSEYSPTSAVCIRRSCIADCGCRRYDFR